MLESRTPYALLGAAMSAAVPAIAGHRILASAAQDLALALVGGFNLPGKLFRQGVGGDGGREVVRGLHDLHRGLRPLAIMTPWVDGGGVLEILDTK